MGRQVNFYMHPAEEELFLTFVLQRPTVKLLSLVSYTPDFSVNLSDLRHSEEFRQLLLWDSQLDLDSKYISEGYSKAYDENSGYYVSTGKKLYIIHSTSAPVIEYSRSFINIDNKLTSGRIWADMYTDTEFGIRLKDERFIHWYDEIAKWLRRNLSRDNELNAYVSEKAKEWRSQGGELY
jgi:hypothetical protein